jgi:LL-diaminopimelate aminotransferase
LEKSFGKQKPFFKGGSVSEFFRNLVAKRCGGKNFDAPNTGYSFSAVLAEERKLAEGNVKGKPETALLTLSIADPTWKMPEPAVTEMVKFYHACPDATRYTDNTGIKGSPETVYGKQVESTHEMIASFLRQRYSHDVGNINEKWVQYSPHGIKGLLSEYLPAAFFDEQTFLAFPIPGYPVIKNAMNCRGAQVVDLPMINGKDGWKIPLEKLKGYKRFKKRFLYLNVPHNPTGMAFNYTDWRRAIVWAKKHKFILIVDEAYTDLRFDDVSTSVLNVEGWDECCLVLQSISKGWNATGARFGWVIGNPTAIAAIGKVMDVKDSGGFGLTLAAAHACLANLNWAIDTRGKYRLLHAELAAGLAEAGFKTGLPDGGLCQFTRAPLSADGVMFATLVECAQWFREKLRISLMHYEVAGERYLRWAVTVKPVPECGLMDEQAVIREAVRRLKQVKFTF